MLLLPCVQQYPLVAGVWWRPVVAGEVNTANASCALREMISAARTVGSEESDEVMVPAVEGLTWFARVRPPVKVVASRSRGKCMDMAVIVHFAEVDLEGSKGLGFGAQ